MIAFHRYFLASEPKAAKELGWQSLKKFVDYHRGMEVQVFPKGFPDGPLYLVIFPEERSSSLDGWPGEAEATARLFAPKPGEPRFVKDHIDYHVFHADGQPVRSFFESSAFNAAVGDFNQDGRPEIMEISALGFPSDNQPPDKNLVMDYVEIKNLEGKPVFAVLFGCRPEGGEEVDPWHCQLIDPKGDGVYELQFGPRHEDKIESKVVFRWDASGQTWTGPASNPGDHFRVLNPKAVEDDLKQIAKAGGLKYPTQFKKVDPFDPFGLADIPPGELSKPYQYESLAKLSDEQLDAYMRGGRTADDIARERFASSTRVPGFWEMAPKEAAIAYIRSHLPPKNRWAWRFAIDELDGRPAPEEGTVTITDGPSGCGAPSGNYVTFLRCSRDESFFVSSKILGQATHDVSPLNCRSSFDVRKIALSYNDARQVLQTLWWMSRTRAQSGPHDQTGGGYPSNDGFAHVEIETPQGRIKIEGTSTGGEVYDQMAFLNLVVRFLSVDVPERLGKDWTAMAPKKGGFSRENATPQERQRLEQQTAELINAFNEGKASPAVAEVALDAVVEFGFQSLRSGIVEMVKRLPPPSSAEKEAALLDKAIEVQVKELGPKEADWSDYYRRVHPITAADPLMQVMGGPAPSPTPKPQSKKSDRRFAKLDALYAQRAALIVNDTISADKATFALKQLDAWDDPAALERYGTADLHISWWACTRLADLGEKERASKVLKHWANAEILDSWKRPFVNSLFKLGVKLDDRLLTPVQRLVQKKELTSKDISALLRIMQDSRLPYDEWEMALQCLVPPEKPLKYDDPEIDLMLTTTKIAFHTSTIARALVLRSGGKVWPRLIQLGSNGSCFGSEFRNVLPFLVMIAQREPDAYRAKLVEVLSASFKNPEHLCNELFWNTWLAELGELKPELERMATSGPDVVESKLVRSGGTDARGQMVWGTRLADAVEMKLDSEPTVAAEPEGAVSRATRGGTSNTRTAKPRFHFSRQIAAVWNEEASLTRSKLLIALAAMNAGKLDEGAMGRIQHELRESTRKITPAEATSLHTFLDRYANEEDEFSEVRKNFIAAARGIIGNR